MNQKRQRREFTDEFKNDAVKLVTEQGYSCTEVGRRLGVNHTNISRWVRLYRNEIQGPDNNKSSQRELLEENNNETRTGGKDSFAVYQHIEYNANEMKTAFSAMLFFFFERFFIKSV